MPTGYTADVATGKITTLKDFALLCARGMGALIMMRDDPIDAPIPERFEPSDFYAKELEKAQAELAELRAMSPKEWQAAADAELASRHAAKAEHDARKVEQRARYDAMIAQVRSWDGAPEGLKAFMLEQLIGSRAFDCPEGERWYESLEPMTGEQWRRTREEDLTRKTARYAEENQKEIDRTNGRNAWVAQLRAALSMTVAEEA